MQAGQAPSALKVDGLSVGFSTGAGRLQALKDVSFEVPQGRITGIVGESGCGKSTLINAILGLLADNGEVTSGSIRLEGKEDLLRLNARQMRALRGERISTVFQDPMGTLNPVLSVGRQMRDIQYRSGLSRREKDARAGDMLRQGRNTGPTRGPLDEPPEIFGGREESRA